METMGERMRRVRGKMTRHKASILSDLAEDTIRYLEKGDSLPNTATLCQLCKGYGCTPNDLIPEWMYE